MRSSKLENRNSELGLSSLPAESRGSLQRIFDFRSRALGWFLALGALAMTLLDPAPASAQGCAMCYTAAAAAKASAIKALRSGILILLFPPALIFIAILVVAYRRRNSFNAPEESPEDQEIRETLERLESVGRRTAVSESEESREPVSIAGGR